MNLFVIGINYRTAPLEIREKTSLKAGDIPRMLRCMKRMIPDSETVILSTCNRTELYLAGPTIATQGDVRKLLPMQKGNIANEKEFDKYIYRLENIKAVEHLFKVASSLDSMVIGEREILGQVKQAYVQSKEAGTTGKILNPLFQKALKVAKAVQTKTDICRGHVSVSAVAVEFAEKVFHDLSTKTVAIVGSGETGEITLQNLMDKGIPGKNILILNRSVERSRTLADKYGGRAIPLDLLDDYLPRADIVISSTHAPHWVIRTESVRKAIAERKRRPMLLIDIAVPRDIEDTAGGLENVYLYNIDDLRGFAEANLAKRRESLHAAWAIVQEHTRNFASWFLKQNFGTMLRQIAETPGAIKKDALSRLFSHFDSATIVQASREDYVETFQLQTGLKRKDENVRK